MLDARLYDLTQSLWGAFGGAMAALRASEAEQPPAIPLLQLRAGLAESPGWFLIQVAEFDPEPLTVELLRVRDIYASERIVAALLELMAGEKWFDRLGDAYHLRLEGRVVLDRIQQNRLRWLAALNLPEAGSRLEQRFGDLIDRSLAAGEPPGTWCLAHSRNRAPAADSSVAARLFQYVADLNAIRDDCHMAAWRPLAVEGYAWEAFALAADGPVTAESLFDALAYRGYTAADYQVALDELAGRGWLAAGDEGYRVTDLGLSVRAETEAATDACFYAPWATLSATEVLEISDDIDTTRLWLERFAAK